MVISRKRSNKKLVVALKPRQRRGRKIPRANSTVSRALALVPARSLKTLQRARSIQRDVLVKHATSKISATLAMGLCNPMSCPNLRLVADVSNADSTVATQLHSYATYKQSTLSSAAVYANYQPLGTGTVVLFRDPLRAYVQFEANPSSSVYTYVAQFISPDSTTYVANQAVTAGNNTLSPLWFTATSVYQPHESYMYVGEYMGYPWFWLDLGTTITFTQGIAEVEDTVSVYLFDGNESQSEYAIVTFTGGVARSFTASAPGYYNFEYYNAVSTANTVAISFTGQSETFSQHAAPFVSDHLLLLREGRVNAASLMMSPVANAFNLNGTIAGAWLEPNALWWQYLNQKTLSKLESSREFAFNTGIYAFIKPHSQGEFQYFNYVTASQTGIVTACRYPLIPAARPVIYSYQVDTTTSSSNNVSLGCEYVLTYVVNLEIVTNDQWHEDHLASSEFRDFMDALSAVRHVEPFHENPLHAKDIINGLKRGFNFARKHVGVIGGALSKIFPAFSAPIGLGTSLVQALPELNVS